MRHYIHEKFLSSQHRINVLVIGAGGTGSHVLTALSTVNSLMEHEGRAGLNVSVFDDDIVSEANLVRGAFGRADVRTYKGATLISRLNAYFGTDWEAYHTQYPCDDSLYSVKPDLLITCVDTGKAREEIYNYLTKNPDKTPVYWLDFGNRKESAQVVLGSFGSVAQPNSEYDTTSVLPTILDLFPNLSKFDDEDNTPSCSLAESLRKQGPFINAMVAKMGINLLCRFLMNHYTETGGVMVELSGCSMSPLPLDRGLWERYGFDPASKEDGL